MTMTSESLISEQPQPRLRQQPEELADNIIAGPMVSSDFVTIELVNPLGLSKRWIEFKAQDGFRYSQCLGQGWRNATMADVKTIGGVPAKLSSFAREGGTKFINGDLILMVVDRKRYLGALKYKHGVAAAVADSAILKTVSKGQAARELINAGANASQNAGKMSLFSPGAADLAGTPLADAGVAAKELGRLGGTRSADDVGGASAPGKG